MSNFTIRPMTEADLLLMVRWLNVPHVAKWFHDHEPTLNAVTEKYLPRIRGEFPVKMFISCIGDKAIGMVQMYRVADFPEYAGTLGNPVNAIGVDLFIGDPSQTGKGIGTKIITKISRDIIPQLYADAEMVVASPSVNNLASIQTFVKAGFEKGPVVTVPNEADPEQVVSLRLDMI